MAQSEWSAYTTNYIPYSWFCLCGFNFCARAKSAKNLICIINYTYITRGLYTWACVFARKFNSALFQQQKITPAKKNPLYGTVLPVETPIHCYHRCVYYTVNQDAQKTWLALVYSSYHGGKPRETSIRKPEGKPLVVTHLWVYLIPHIHVHLHLHIHVHGNMY